MSYNAKKYHKSVKSQIMLSAYSFRDLQYILVLPDYNSTSDAHVQLVMLMAVPFSIQAIETLSPDHKANPWRLIYPLHRNCLTI